MAAEHRPHPRAARSARAGPRSTTRPARTCTGRSAHCVGRPHRRPGRHDRSRGVPGAVAPQSARRTRCGSAPGARGGVRDGRLAGACRSARGGTRRLGRRRRPAAALAADTPRGADPPAADAEPAALARPARCTSNHCAQRHATPLGLHSWTGRFDADEARRRSSSGSRGPRSASGCAATGLDGFDPRPRAGDRSVRHASTAVRGTWCRSVPQQVLAGRQFDTGAAGGRVGELRRQLGSSAAGKKMRELISTYGDLITEVLPCVLVSPDSLARFFPAVAGLFDIVVFDEASQVRVADAVGAMGRARSVVVVGDSKQMPPTSFAESVHGRRRLDAEPATGSSRTRSRSSPSACRPGSTPAAELALPQPGRGADRLQQRPLLRRRACRRSRAPTGPDRSGGSRWSAWTGSSSAAARGGCCAPTRWRREAVVGRDRGAGSPRRPDGAAVARRGHVQPAAARPHRGPAAGRWTTPGSPRRSTTPTGCSSRTWRTCRATSATSSCSRPRSA